VNALIEISDLTYRPEDLPPDRQAILHGINLEIEPGSFTALIGPNGSGKTTLLKQMGGLLLPTIGQVLVNGLDTRDLENHRNLRSMIGMVFQNPADQIVASTVEEDIAFGLENANLPTATIRERVAEQLVYVGLTEDVARPPHLLSGGQIQKCALAGVLARQPNILLFDEPTSMLDSLSRKTFLQQIKLLHSQGMTIVYVTHHMDEAFQADRLMVLQDGQIKMLGSPKEVRQNYNKLHEIGLELPGVVVMADKLRALGWDLPSELHTEEDLINSLPHFEHQTSLGSVKTSQNDQAIIIDVDDVYYTYLADTPLAKPALQGASLSVSAGEIHGLAGSNGSGKSTLLQHLNGILRPVHGRVQVGSLEVEKPETPLKEVIKKVGLVFQSPESQFFEIFVGDEIAYGPKQINMGELRERVKTAMAQVGLDFEAFKDRRLETLSGGEKRKVAIASTIILDQDILLFDEPTAGMDPQSRDELLALFRNLSADGKTILMASHRLEEMATVTQSLSVMKGGKVVNSGSTQQVLKDNEVLFQAQLEPPFAIVISHHLIEKGWPITDLDTSTPDRLVACLKKVMK